MGEEGMDDLISAMIPGFIVGGLLGSAFTGIKYKLQRKPKYTETFRTYGIHVEAFEDNDAVAQTFIQLLPKRQIDPASFDGAIKWCDQLMSLSANLSIQEAKPDHFLWAQELVHSYVVTYIETFSSEL